MTEIKFAEKSGKFFQKITENIFLRKSGSILTEGAIFIPIYIIAAVTLLYLVKICMISVIVTDAAENAAGITSVAESDAAVYSSGSYLGDNGLDEACLKSFCTAFEGKSGIEDLKSIKLIYDTKISLPLPIIKQASVTCIMPVRHWTGSSFTGSPYGFEMMEKDEDSSLVVIFPRSGSRYHDSDCRYVKSYAEKTLLTAELRNKYSACPLCTKGKLKDGSSVYIFPSGKSYHCKDCSSVTRYVTEIDVQDAVSKGYTACTVCGG